MIDSGGGRLQEANIGEIEISEIIRSILEARSVGIKTVGVICGNNGAYDEIDLLSKELSQTLDWHSVCKLIPEFGNDLIIDLGPGEAMSSIYNAASSKSIPIITVAQFKTIGGLKMALSSL